VSHDALRKQLRSFVGTGKKVRLARSIASDPWHNGFLLAVGREWVLIHQFHDFYPEGFAALRVKDLTDVRSGEYERHWERMLTAEGLLDRLAAPAGVSLEDTSALLESLRTRGQNVIVECEDPEEDCEDFYIGQIDSVGEGSVRFANFDGLGRWDADLHTIPLAEITRVQFETPYVRTFSKYLAGPCPASECP
jgi:hypothetical protein